MHENTVCAIFINVPRVSWDVFRLFLLSCSTSSDVVTVASELILLFLGRDTIHRLSFLGSWNTDDDGDSPHVL